MSIKVESTTDSEDAVNAAMGDLAHDKEEVEQNDNDMDVENKPSSEEGKSSVAPQDSEEAETDNDQEESDTSEEEEDSDENQNDGEKAKKPKKKGGFKRRIDRLQRKNSAYEQQIEELRAKLEAQQSQESSESKTQEKPQTEDGRPTRPNLEDYENFQDYEEARDQYYEDLTNWKVGKALAEKDQEAKQKQTRQLIQKKATEFIEKVEEFADQTEDFDEVFDNIRDIKPSPALQANLRELEDPGPVLYQLAKDPEFFQQINSMGVTGVGRALGRIEAKLQGSSSTSQSKTSDQKTKTRAPAPIDPVGSRGAGASRKSPDEMSFRNYEAWYEKTYG